MRDQQQNLPERLITVMRQSGTMTPIPNSALSGRDGAQSACDMFETTQARVMQYIQKQQYNNAFQTALNASDLNLLVNLCENVNPVQLFETKPCVLVQPVLLSLIQQLSQELHLNTELKTKYLEEAVMSLDYANPLGREYIPNVITILLQKLQQFIQAHPNDKITKRIKMLALASQSLLVR
jgi:enhancer of mRNA-decapping protein 4